MPKAKDVLKAHADRESSLRYPNATQDEAIEINSLYMLLDGINESAILSEEQLSFVKRRIGGVSPGEGVGERIIAMATYINTCH